MSTLSRSRIFEGGLIAESRHRLQPNRTPQERASDACADGQHELCGRNPRGLQFKTIEADGNDLASGWILIAYYLPGQVAAA
jgi:hypothetical protein